MNYYAIGDRTYVISHHGVIGMHWGVRRFQPYGQGYDRKGGKTGKVVGEASDLQRNYNALNRKRSGVKFRTAVAAGTAALAPTAIGTAATVASANPGVALMTIYTAPAAGWIASAAITEKGAAKVDKLLKESPIANEKVTISEGTILSRTSANASGDEGRLYMRLNNSKRDNEYYDKEWPKRLRQISGDENQKIYRNTYQVRTALVAPSKEERIKIAEAMVNADRGLKVEFGKSYATQQLRLRTGKLGAKTLKDIEKEYDLPSMKKWVKETYKDAEYRAIGNGKGKLDFSKNENESYRRFVATIPTSPKLMNRYIKELKKNGYSAVFDDNSREVADTPFIVFDSKYVQQTGSKELK